MTHQSLRKQEPMTRSDMARTPEVQPRRRLPSRFIQFVIVASVSVSSPAMADDWLQWGGPNGDFTVEAKGLAEKWPTTGPKQHLQGVFAEPGDTIGDGARSRIAAPGDGADGPQQQRRIVGKNCRQGFCLLGLAIGLATQE
jgi:hypothetical protein